MRIPNPVPKSKARKENYLHEKRRKTSPCWQTVMLLAKKWKKWPIKKKRCEEPLTYMSPPPPYGRAYGRRCVSCPAVLNWLWEGTDGWWAGSLPDRGAALHSILLVLGPISARSRNPPPTVYCSKQEPKFGQKGEGVKALFMWDLKKQICGSEFISPRSRWSLFLKGSPARVFMSKMF
jgi:hypothetical protein